jgi:hypothetical protein
VKLIAFLILALGVCAALVVFFRKSIAPYGHREAFMRGMDRCLQDYAEAHQGSFPAGENAYSAIAKLYPDYCFPCELLAGLSGNIEDVTNALRTGQSLSNVTSWNYVPGLRQDDDPQIALLWESKAGLSSSGRWKIKRTRPVLLLSRDTINIPTSEWSDFTIRQQLLRNGRKANTGRGVEPVR